MKPKILIIGAGGHGKVVCDTILTQGEYDIAGFADSTIPVGEIVIDTYKVISTQDTIHTIKNSFDFFIVAIGNNKIRQKIYNEMSQIIKPAIVIHNSAVIGSNVIIGKGAVILANSVINSSSRVGKNTIVNAGVIVDHDCKIGDNIHLSIGTMVGSNSEISDNNTTTVGERIVPFSKIC